MTEGGLLSNVAFQAMVAENFVCVRLFSTALGGGHAQVQKFLPNISDALRRHLMYQGNSLVVLTPDGKIIDTRYKAVAQSAENVAVVINDNSQASRQIGEYYVRKRGIPPSNVFHIKTSPSDTIDRVTSLGAGTDVTVESQHAGVFQW